MTRKEAIYEFQDVLGELHDEIEITENLKNACRLAIKALEQEQKTGHWIKKDGYGDCSECGSHIVTEWDYCPKCGARMVEP